MNVDDETYWVELKNTCYAPTLCINLILLGTLMLQGCKLSDTSKGYAIVKDGSVVMNVQVTNNVLVVDLVTPGKEEKGVRDIVLNTIQALASQEKTVLKGSLGHFYRRFGHLNYADVERMAADPSNVIELTDSIRENSLTCEGGRRAKNAQPRNDNGGNAPIDWLA